MDASSLVGVSFLAPELPVISGLPFAISSG